MIINPRSSGRTRRWFLWLSLLLVATSAVVYTLHYLIFRDPHHIFIFMIGDFGFLFLDVLLVIILIERLLASREKRIIRQKLNMVIGTFFSEVGLGLMTRFSKSAGDAGRSLPLAEIREDWTREDFQNARSALRAHPVDLRIPPSDFEDLKTFLSGKRGFLVRLLENPLLLENERFTELLRAVFHLCEELDFRTEGMAILPPSDLSHIASDAARAHALILNEWLVYAEYLKNSYPYLFSLASRINPLGSSPSPIVAEPRPI